MFSLFQLHIEKMDFGSKTLEKIIDETVKVKELGEMLIQIYKAIGIWWNFWARRKRTQTTKCEFDSTMFSFVWSHFIH